MFRYYVRIALRSLYIQKIFPFINILGLSIGLAVVLLISMFSFNEMSFDKQFKESKNIYRVITQMNVMPYETMATSSGAFALAMQTAIPEVVAAVRIHRESYPVRFDENEEPNTFRVYWVDDDFFRLFDTPFLYGSPEDIFTRPNTIALSEKLVERLYGDKNPIGETFSLNDRHLMEVVAVFKSYPTNSSFAEFNSIASMQNSTPIPNFFRFPGLDNITFATFFLLSENADTAFVHAKMRDVITQVTDG